MVSFGEKAKIKKAGNLNQGRSYVTTTVQMHRSKIDNSTPEFTFTVCMQQQLCSYKQSVGYSGAVGQISRLFVLLGPVQSKSVEWEGRSYLDGRCFCNRNFHTKKLIIFIRRIIFICPPLRKYCVAIYCLVISEFFEKEFLIPQEDSIDYHHPEESPVNSTINPQSKII